MVNQLLKTFEIVEEMGKGEDEAAVEFLLKYKNLVFHFSNSPVVNQFPEVV